MQVRKSFFLFTVMEYERHFGQLSSIYTEQTTTVSHILERVPGRVGEYKHQRAIDP